MFEECRKIRAWTECLDCRFLATEHCPLKGDNPIDRLENMIKMKEDSRYQGFKKELSPIRNT